MSERQRSAPSSIKAFLAKLEAVVNSLPSDEERQQVRNSIDAIIGFLTDLRKDFENLPSREETESIRQATMTISAFMERVKREPALSSMFGVRRAGARQGVGQMIADPARAKAIVAELETLPVDEIRSRLSIDDRSMEELRAVATEVGVRSTDRLSREALAHQIAMKIANFRGYRQLSGESKPD